SAALPRLLRAPRCSAGGRLRRRLPIAAENGILVVIIEGRHLDGDVEDAADVVIVGSGAAGAVVAAHLAEAGQSVIIAEEGPHVPHARYGRMRPSETMRHIWREGGLTMAIGLGDSPVVNVMMGECVGGSSVLTGGV